MPTRKRVLGHVLAAFCVGALVACGGNAPEDGGPQNVVQLSDEATTFVAPTGEQVTFPAVPDVLDAEVEVVVTPTGAQGMPPEAQLLTRAVTLTFRNLAALPDGSTLSLDLPHRDSAGLGAQSLSSNAFILVSSRDRTTAINERDWSYFGNYETANDRSVLTVTKAGLDAIALSLDAQGPSLDGKPMGFQVATNVPDLFKPSAKGLYRVNLTSGSVPTMQEAAQDPVEYCHGHHSNLFSRLPSQASPTGRERRVAILLVHGYQSIGIPLGDNLSKYAHCNVWLNTIAAFQHRGGDWETLRNQSDLYAVRYDTDDRVVLSGNEVHGHLDQLSRQLGYQDIVILGHSMGGVVSVAARQQAGYPEEVHGIVTLGTPHMGAPMRCSHAEDGFCLGWKYGPGSWGDLSWLVTSGISLIAPSDGGLDLTFAYYPVEDALSIANPFLVDLWREPRNSENVHAVYGSSEFPTFDTSVGGTVGKTLLGLDVGFNDMFIPASSAAGSRVLNEDGRPYASMFPRVTGVGRDHEQLHAGCRGCSDGRTSQNPYDPYFDVVAGALLGFVGSGLDPIVRVSVAPTSVTLEPGATQSFTATVTGATNTSVSWSATCGSVAGSANTVTYTAPASVSGVGTCFVRATSVEGQGAWGQAIVSLVLDPNDPPPTTPCTSPSDIAPISDAGLERAIRERVGLSAGDALLCQHLQQLFSLDGTGHGIHSLAGLEHAVNLGYLYLGNNSLLDVAQLANLQELRTVYLGNNLLTDLSPLASLANLTVLDLGNFGGYENRNAIQDLTPLAGLVNLATLRLDHNSVSDISSIAGLVDLTILDLAYNRLEDITLLSGLTKLLVLDLSNNQIRSITSLAPLTEMNSLVLNNNLISDVAALSGMRELTFLRLYWNDLEDIGPIANLVNLESLEIFENRIRDISPLRYLSSLMYLRIDDNMIEDLAPLANVTSLRSLSAWDNNISSLEPLAGLTDLEYLSLSNDSSREPRNLISDLSPLTALEGLVTISLRYNAISDLSPLENLADLTNLDLFHNAISDITTLSSLSMLSDVNLKGNFVRDLTALVANVGLGDGDRVNLEYNCLDLSDGSDASLAVAALSARGVSFGFLDRASQRPWYACAE